MRRIGGLFGRSPYGPLYELMVQVQRCADELPSLMQAMAQADKGTVEDAVARIHGLEHEADEIKGEIRDRLSKSLFTSVERSEVLLLVGCIDSIADDCEKAAKLVSVRKTPVPEGVASALVGLAGKGREAAAMLLDVLGKLRDVIEGSSDRSEAEVVLSGIRDLGRHEFDVEEAEIGLLREIFKLEAPAEGPGPAGEKLSPVDLIILMRVVNQVAAVARQAENAGDTLRRLVLNR